MLCLLPPTAQEFAGLQLASDLFPAASIDFQLHISFTAYLLLQRDTVECFSQVYTSQPTKLISFIIITDQNVLKYLFLNMCRRHICIQVPSQTIRNCVHLACYYRDCESPAVNPGNWIQVLCKSNKHSQQLLSQHILSCV